MTDDRSSSLERTGFAALAALLLAPVVAHGVWRPLVHVFGLAGSAERVTGASLAMGAVIVVAGHLRRDRASWLPAAIGCLVAVAASAVLSLGISGLLTLAGVAAAVAWLERWLSSRLPSTLDGLVSRNKVLTALYLLGALAAVVSTARLSVFVGDPARVDLQTLPGDEFMETHSCLTAYVRAAALVREGVDNVYDDRWWHGSHGLPPLAPGSENPYRPFDLDNLSYPPPFLMVVAPLAALEGDFLAQRGLWFGLNGLLLAIGLWIVARWIDGPGAHRVLLLTPLFFGSIPVLLNLQIGNFQAATVVLAVLAMVAFDRGRHAAGGALLALTILSKISPGILGIVLLAQRRFRAAAFAAGFGVLLLGLSTLLSGTDPLKHFLTFALPRLSSGAAFPFMETEAGLITNLSPFGFAFKLPLLGVEVGDPWRLAPIIARVYTGLLLVLAVVAARRRGDRLEQAVTWMALLVLAALQSPFAPGYVFLGLLWATTLLAANVRLRGGIALGLLWPASLLVPPGLSPEGKVVLGMVQTTIVVGVCTWLIVRTRWRTE